MIRFLNKLQPWALCFLRLAVGFAMVYNSYDKVIPKDGFHHGNYLAAMEHFNDFVVTLGLPRWLGYVSTVTEFLGGICVLVGFLTRLWSLLIVINMIVALATVNVHHGYTGSAYTVALITMAFMLLCAGSGALAFDRRLGIS